MKVTDVRSWSFGPDSMLPGLFILQLETDTGLLGLGETFYLPTACREILDLYIGPQLVGRDPRDIEGIWRSLYSSMSRFAGRGAEYRTLAALDVALWDIAAQATGTPVAAMLGGSVSQSVNVYNTCVGPRYTQSSGVLSPGNGIADPDDPLDDYAAWKHDAGDLALRLRAAGFTGMKLWPFDALAKQTNGRRPSKDLLAQACRPLRQIRDAVGDDMKIMIDGHGLWTVDGAVAVANACEEFNPEWLEDLILATPLEGLVALRRRTSAPLLVSEYLGTVAEYRDVLEAGVADIIMIDPTWAGGITESRRICALADSYGLPVSFHDCTGPVTLMAGVHLGLVATNAHSQEYARGLADHVYPQIADYELAVAQSQARITQAPGLGMRLSESISEFPGVAVSHVALGS